MLLLSLIQIVNLLANVLIMLILVQFVIGMLFAFNVVSPQNEILSAIYRSINVLLDPVLEPIRRYLPNTGAIDWSPLVLIILLQVLLIILTSLAGAA